MTTPILEARDLSKLFPGPKKLFTPARFVTAVDRVSLAVMPGETLAIVGESGSGKSTLGRLLLRLLAASEGRVFYQGKRSPTPRARASISSGASCRLSFRIPSPR
jgi:peptide/nickel transport system ATP-binding protein